MASFALVYTLFASVNAHFVAPRDPIQTLEVAIPSQGAPFTTTVTACGTVPAFAVVGIPTGTFEPGNKTIYLPAQAGATSTTIVDPASNATEVIFATPLQGTCDDFQIPAAEPTAAGTGSSAAPSASPTADACPATGCQGQVVKIGQRVIDAINKVTLISQNLQAPARLLGSSPTSPFKRDNEVAQAPGPDLLDGLRNIISLVTADLPELAAIPPFPPGCDTDAIVIALIQFVKVHQALLNILIGRSGLITQGPFRRNAPSAEGDHAVKIFERTPKKGFKDSEGALIGAAIAAVLRGIESVVDDLAFTILKLIPTRSACAKQQKDAIDGTLADAIGAYS